MPINNAKQAHQLTLVPNRRIFDLQLADAFLANDQLTVIVAPAVAVLSSWVEQTATRIDLLGGKASALTADSLRLDGIWRQAVGADSEDSATAFETLTLARFARAADRQLRQWVGNHQPAGLDARFGEWRARVKTTLHNRQMFTAEDWTSHLQFQLEEARELPLMLPQQIRLHGFLEFTQLEQGLLAALRQRGVQVVDSGGRLDDSPADNAAGEPVLGTAEQAVPREAKEQSKEQREFSANRQMHAFDQPGDELHAVAAWAQQRLQQGSPRLAIIVNGLPALAGELQAVLDRHLHPQDGLQVSLSGDALYHLPDASRLSDHAIINDGLLLLRLVTRGVRERHAFPVISQLLLSSHLAGADSEHTGRAQFEQRLRHDGAHWRSLQELRKLLARWKLEETLPQLTQLLNPSLNASPDHAPVADSDPATRLLERLRQWGWPGPLVQGSLAERRVNRLVGLIEQLRLLSPATEREALATLSLWCQETFITERGGPLSSIQVLSPEDAVDQHFDAAWVVNIHEGNWPAYPVTNALLPPAATEHIPRATPEGEMRYTRALQQHLETLAPELHFSWSSSGGDAPRQPSPLLLAASGFEPGHELTAPVAPPGADLNGQCLYWPSHNHEHKAVSTDSGGYLGHPWLEAVDDSQGLPLQAGGTQHIPGGAGMFRDQSACPMMAYLLHRLQLRFDPMPGPFADHAFRGKLLHEALYHLYEGQVGRAGVPAAAHIPAAVTAALRQCHADRQLATPSFRAEQLRLERLLQQWLSVDQQRAGFVVTALEQAREFEYRGYRISIRMDRMDELADGRHLIIDYKSGAVDAKPWASERIGQAQLPVYAVLLESERAGSVGGLALASVRLGDCGFSGVVDDEQAACGKLYSSTNRRTAWAKNFASWDDLLQHWQTGIGQLADEIIGGAADNRLYVKDGVKYAGLDGVLRRNEGETWLLAHASQAPEIERD